MSLFGDIFVFFSFDRNFFIWPFNATCRKKAVSFDSAKNTTQVLPSKAGKHQKPPSSSTKNKTKFAARAEPAKKKNGFDVEAFQKHMREMDNDKAELLKQKAELEKRIEVIERKQRDRQAEYIYPNTFSVSRYVVLCHFVMIHVVLLYIKMLVTTRHTLKKFNYRMCRKKKAQAAAWCPAQPCLRQ